MIDYWHVIVLTFVGFVALAAMLLIPVWRFLAREEEVASAHDAHVAASAADDESTGPL